MALNRRGGHLVAARHRVLVAAAASAMIAASCAGSDGGQTASNDEAPSDAPQITEATVAETPDADHLRRNSSAPPVPELGDPPGWSDPAGSTVRFTDVTDAAGADVRFDSALDVALVRDTAIMMGGVGAGDFDNDGDTDLFVLGGGDELDSLLVNDGNGAFTDEAVAAGLADPHLGAGVAVADYDNDGDLDLYVTSQGPSPAAPSPGPTGSTATTAT